MQDILHSSSRRREVVLEPLSLILIAFFAAFTQSLTGFGSGLVAMATFPGLIGIRVAAPLVALLCTTIELLLLARYWQALNLRAIRLLVLALILGAPWGILALRRVDEEIVMGFLGAVLAGYALYALLNPRLPELRQPAWTFGFGFVAGVLGGAYNTSGPPVVIYGNCRRWSPAEFRGNLQGFFLVNDLIVITGHTLSRNMTALVLHNYLTIAPALLLGVFLGGRLSRRVDPAVFRKIVLVFLLLMGLRMLLV